MLKNDQSTVTK